MKKTFATKDELFAYLKQNKSLLIEEKKCEFKKADAVFSSQSGQKTLKTEADKSAGMPAEGNIELEKIAVSVVINSTNILDSHGDVHIPGLWKKSLNEKKNIYLLQEHSMTFDKVIAENVSAYTKSMPFSELGFPEYKGNAECLIFDASVEEKRNEFMFEQYLNGYVKNHSVGMRYVTLYLCINSNDKVYKEEKQNWDKYYPMIVNSEDADAQGYFWAVTEAKIVEGSAVVVGSNGVTPTLQVSATQNVEAEDTTSTNNSNKEDQTDKTTEQEKQKQEAEQRRVEKIKSITNHFKL